MGHSASDRIAAALERDSRWLHALARALTRDEELASDAAQTTLMRAWQREHRDGTPRKRRWLARVLSNAIREQVRSAGLRRGKELDAARSAEVEDGTLGLERLELQRNVIESLEALPDPYRTTLVLRFVDGLSIRAVAARTGVPPKTVYTRVERGLTQLRERLDRKFGDDRHLWATALAALPAPHRNWTPLITGAGAMGTGVKLGLGAAIVATGILAAMSRRGERSTVPHLEAPISEAQELTSPNLEPKAAPASISRETLPVEAAADLPVVDDFPETVAAASAGVVVRGQVLSDLGEALAGVHVQAAEHAELVATDSRGQFELELDPELLPVAIRVEDEEYSALREALVRTGTTSFPHTLVAAPAGDVSGTVIDTDGNPIANAAITVGANPTLFEFPGVLDSTTRVRRRTTSDADGHFALERVALSSHSSADAHHTGYESASVPLRGAEANLRLVLRPADSSDSAPEATGFVYLPDGTPAEGALVRYGMSEASVGPDGAFRIPLANDPLPSQVLAAGKEGYSAALVERYGELQAFSHPYAPAPVALVLGEEPLRIAGRVVDEEGRGLERWQVYLLGGQSLSRWRTPPALAEELSGTRTVVETNADGFFEFIGLLPREYELLAVDRASMLGVRSGPVPAGTVDALLTPDTSSVHERVRGRVIDRSGNEVPNALVGVARVTFRTENGYTSMSGAGVSTDAQGRFELANVPHQGIALTVGGDAVVPVFRELDDGYSADDIELTVSRRCHFRVQVTGADLENLFIRVLDANGQRLLISSFSANGSYTSRRKALDDGKMETAATSAEAAFVILTRGDSELELARRELVLVPGEVCTVPIEL